MKFLLCLLFFLQFTFINGANSQDVTRSRPIENTTLTIEEAVEIAMLNKPSLQAYKHAIEASKARGMQAWSDYLPQVNLTTNIAQGIGQHNPQTTIALGAQQLVYSFAGPIEKYKLAKKQTNIVELTNDKDKKAIKNAVEAAFLDCWKTQKQQASIIALHQSSTTTYKKQAHANKLELLDKNDWLKSNSAHAQNLALVDSYYEGVELVQKKLEFFMGQPIDLALTKIEKLTEKNQHILAIALEWQEPKEINPLPLTTYYKYAMTNREELKIADKTIGVAKDQTRIAQRSNLPSLSVQASTGYQSRASSSLGIIEEHIGQQPPRNFYNLGVQVSWPIFNGLLNDYVEKEAHANMIKEMLNKDQAMQDIKISIDTAYYTLTQALITLKANKIDLIYARNNLTLKKLQFKTGDISKVELDEAIEQAERAEYKALDLITDAAIKERNLAFACGYPKELF